MTTHLVTPPDLMVLGHIARDHIGSSVRLGGAAAFAARAAACLNLRTGLVTVAPADPELLAPILTERRIDLERQDADEPTTFELDYSGPVRRIWLRARARSLTRGDIPVRFARAPVAYVGPVIGECGNDLLDALHCETIVVGAQGWLRRAAEDGTIEPALLPEALNPPRRIDAIVFSELDHPQAELLAERFSKTVTVVALTRGAAGVTLFRKDRRVDIPAAPAHEVDPTGAGDVFGVVFALAWHRGASIEDAARRATEAAARVVEGPDLGSLPAAADSLRLAPAATIAARSRVAMG